MATIEPSTQRSPRGPRFPAIPIALILYGILNAVLYASLLPLWEGFDEPFHYAYAESIAEQHTLPIIGVTPISEEIWLSLHLAPGSPAVKLNLPWIVTFGEYFRLPLGDRARVRAQLASLHRNGGLSHAPNYEAQQAPLAYILLALADDALSPLNLIARIWALRVLCGSFAAVITSLALMSLATKLRISLRFRMQLIFVAMSWQMFYASTAHICNDWLAVPLMVLLMERCLAVQENPTLRNQAVTMAILTAGLLTRAWFLALIPLVVIILVRLAMAGRVAWKSVASLCAIATACCAPWYARNLRLYHDLSGMQQAVGGNSLPLILGSGGRLPWLRSLKQLTFSSVWTGNNSFTSFSVVTISLLLFGLFIAGGAYAFGLFHRRGQIPATEWIVLAGCALHGSALIYSTALVYSSTSGAFVSTLPWYTQPLIPVLLTLCFTGLARAGKAGTAIGVWLVCLSAYVIVGTYWAKLLPLYGGFPGDRTTLASLFKWYSGDTARIQSNLSTTAMIDPRLILLLLLAQAALAIGLAVLLNHAALRRLGGRTVAVQ